MPPSLAARTYSVDPTMFKNVPLGCWGWVVGRLVAWLGLHQVHYVISKISSILTGNTKDHFHSFLHFFLDNLHFDPDSKAVLEILHVLLLVGSLVKELTTLYATFIYYIAEMLLGFQIRVGKQ